MKVILFILLYPVCLIVPIVYGWTAYDGFQTILTFAVAFYIAGVMKFCLPTKDECIDAIDNRILTVISMAAFLLLSVTFFISEEFYAVNTVFSGKLCWLGLMLGVLVVTIVTFEAGRRGKYFYYNSIRDNSGFFTMFSIIFIVFCIVLPTIINRSFANETPKCDNHTLRDKDMVNPNKYFDDRYYLFFQLNPEISNKKRFEVYKDFYDKVSIGDTIEICLQKGALGFDIARNFRKIASKAKKPPLKTDNYDNTTEYSNVITVQMEEKNSNLNDVIEILKEVNMSVRYINSMSYKNSVLYFIETKDGELQAVFNVLRENGINVTKVKKITTQATN